jgi:UPF0716 protein FxsA
MPFASKIAIGLVLVAFPLLEIALLIRAAHWLGVPAILFIVIATAAAGVAIIRREGLKALLKVIYSAQQGRGVLEPILDGFIKTSAAMLLIFPGLISDAFGAVLLIPAVRSRLIKTGVPRLLAGLAFHTETFEARTAARKTRRYDHGDDGEAIIIEGEYERVEDPPPPQTQIRKRG